MFDPWLCHHTILSFSSRKTMKKDDFLCKLSAGNTLKVSSAKTILMNCKENELLFRAFIPDCSHVKKKVIQGNDTYFACFRKTDCRQLRGSLEGGNNVLQVLFAKQNRTARFFSYFAGLTALKKTFVFFFFFKSPFINFLNRSFCCWYFLQ